MNVVARAVGWIPPRVLVLGSRALQALALPVVALLISMSGSLSNEIEDAISFCNVLFVGNLCASAVVLASFGPRRIGRDLKALTVGMRWEMLAFASLSALLSGLIFTALETTTVTNSVLLARLGPVLFALGSALFLGQALARADWLGFGLIGLGTLAVVFAGGGFTLVTGDWLIIASAFVYAAVTIMSGRLLPVTGLPAMVFARNFFSAIVFFVIANALYGPNHFMDAFYGPLWGVMLVYSLFVIVAAQFAWYRGIELLPPATVARWAVASPVFAVAYAYVINGEQPGRMQLIALGLIVVGVLVTNLGKLLPAGSSGSAETSVAAN